MSLSNTAYTLLLSCLEGIAQNQGHKPCSYLSSHCTVTQFRITSPSNHFCSVAAASPNPFQPCARSWRQLSHSGLQQIQNPVSGTRWQWMEWCKWHTLLRCNLKSPEYRQVDTIDSFSQIPLKYAARCILSSPHQSARNHLTHVVNPTTTNYL